MARIIGVLLAVAAVPAGAADLGRTPRHHVADIDFTGPECGPADTPARDVTLDVTFRHAAGEEITVPGFWNGDGRGGAKGNVFTVRFRPTATGVWTIARTAANRPELHGEREGDSLVCVASEHPGGWVAEGRWYARSDGSRPYVVGNTHYSFLSRRGKEGPIPGSPADDVRANAKFFKKLRFALTADRYPDPDLKPFFDEAGRPSDDGRHSARPNPRWFGERADAAVRAGFETDLVCDLILCGPDTQESRSTLQGDPRPWLRYVAARYGASPNVWFCLCNEWGIQNPRHSAAQIVAAGRTLRSCLPYRSPLSVHGEEGDWNEELNGDWCDHVILQSKQRTLAAADIVTRNFRRGGGKPVCNDENAYQGEGDGFSLGDTVEGCFGTFLGGGYPTTGEKPGGKLGQYFRGGFDPQAHTAAPPLALLRKSVDGNVRFWELAPLAVGQTPFAGLGGKARVLGRSGWEYAVGTDREHAGVAVELPPGRWRVTQADLLGGTDRLLAEDAAGRLVVSTPDSRAVLTHFRRTDR